MAQVDLRCRYHPFPARPSPGFPNRIEVWYPIVKLGLKAAQAPIRTVALLDTGADFTFFGTRWADALGIDWRAAPEVHFKGVGATDNIGYAADVTLFLVDDPFSWPARVVFSPAMDGFPFPLLGHTGFFEHFEVRFKTATRQLRIHLR